MLQAYEELFEGGDNENGNEGGNNVAGRAWGDIAAEEDEIAKENEGYITPVTKRGESNSRRLENSVLSCENRYEILNSLNDEEGQSTVNIEGVSANNIRRGSR